MKSIATSLAVLTLAAGALLAAAPAASAAPAPVTIPVSAAAGGDLSTRGAACDTFGLCGVVVNNATSVANLTVTCNLGNPWLDTRTISPGQRAGCKDSDGFYARDCYAYSINGQSPTWGDNHWIKVVDGQNATVRITRVPCS
jgi:spore coat protein U-like protein